MIEPEEPIDYSKEPKNNRDEFWMALKVLPVLIAVVIFHQLGGLRFWPAVWTGFAVGTVLGWFLVPMTRRLMKTRYASVINLRLGEHPADASCGAYVFIFFFLLIYHLFFVAVPAQRAQNEAKKNRKPKITAPIRNS